MSMTARQKLFVAEYLKDKNGKRAYLRAGFKVKERTAEVESSKLLRKPEIKAAVDHGLAKQLDRVELDGDMILRELKRVAFLDVTQAYTKEGGLKQLQEMPEDVRKSIIGFDTGEAWVGDEKDGYASMGSVKKIRFADKLRALELLGKNQRLFDQKIEITGRVTLEELVVGAEELDKEK